MSIEWVNIPQAVYVEKLNKSYAQGVRDGKISALERIFESFCVNVGDLGESGYPNLVLSDLKNTIIRQIDKLKEGE